MNRSTTICRLKRIQCTSRSSPSHRRLTRRAASSDLLLERDFVRYTNDEAMTRASFLFEMQQRLHTDYKYPEHPYIELCVVEIRNYLQTRRDAKPDDLLTFYRSSTEIR